MARHYSCNQYNDAFNSKKLGNFEVPKFYCEKPFARAGSSSFIANEKGYIIPGYPRAEKSDPPSYGAWDLPRKITREIANQINGLAYIKEKKKRCSRQTKSIPLVLVQDVEQESDEEESIIVPEEDVKDKAQLIEEIVEGAEQDKEEVEDEYLICPIHNVRVKKRGKDDNGSAKGQADLVEKYCKCIP